MTEGQESYLVAPGVELQNYVKKVPNDEGTYVVVTEHREHIERIPQPLTPEERAAKQQSERLALGVVALMVSGFLGLVAWVSYQDNKAMNRAVSPAQEEPKDG